MSAQKVLTTGLVIPSNVDHAAGHYLLQKNVL